jgi:hypothetical protein
VTDQKLFGPERKPYENPVDDRLAPSSYGAGAVFGVVEMAVRHLAAHDQPMTPANVGAISTMFARIIIKAQLELGEKSAGWHAFLNTRLRGALYTAMEATPYRFSDSIEAWEAELQRLVISIAKTAAWLYAKHPRELVEG